MTTLSTSIKDLATIIEKTDADQVSSKSRIAIVGSPGDKLKFICDNKEIIFKIINIAKIFTGPKGDKILDTLKEVIESLCS
jgi:hypothetical protein